MEIVRDRPCTSRTPRAGGALAKNNAHRCQRRKKGHRHRSVPGCSVAGADGSPAEDARERPLRDGLPFSNRIRGCGRPVLCQTAGQHVRLGNSQGSTGADSQRGFGSRLASSRGGCAVCRSWGRRHIVIYCALAGLPIDRRYDQPQGGGNWFPFDIDSRQVRHNWRSMEEAFDAQSEADVVLGKAEHA